MPDDKPIVHPYIPNSVPAIKQQMLEAVDAASVDELYQDVPDALRLKRPLDLPEPFLSEYALRPVRGSVSGPPWASLSTANGLAGWAGWQ